MKEIILDFISHHGKTTFKTLAREFNINSSTLENILLELKLDGKILEISNRYSLLPDSVLVGEISMTKSGNKVIFYDGKPISVSSNFFDHVIINDVVNFIINERGEADIVSIIERRIKDVTCKVVVNGKKKKLECFHKGIEVKLPESVMKKLSNGEIVLVNIGVNNIDSGYCECTFKGVIGHANDPNIDDIVIALNYGFGNDYSDEYLEEINKIPTAVRNSDLVGRTDYRHLPFFTMDCMTAKDLDDAIYGEKLADGSYIAYVSISDVSYYVKITSEIFKRAEYSVENIGHYALGIDIYTHFTSPIRRLCDLMVHTILDILLDDYELADKFDFEKFEEFLEDMCKQASLMERQADAAEVAGERLAIVKSMKNHIGEEFDAVVLEANQNLRVKVNGIDCFVKYKSLSNDFEYDESVSKYYDKNNNMYLKMGAKVNVILKSVNLTNRTIVVDITGVISSKKRIRKK